MGMIQVNPQGRLHIRPGGNLWGVARNEDGDDSGEHPQGRLHFRIVGWSDFEKEKATHSMLCPTVVGPQFQNFMS